MVQRKANAWRCVRVCSERQSRKCGAPSCSRKVQMSDAVGRRTRRTGTSANWRPSTEFGQSVRAEREDRANRQREGAEPVIHQ